MKLAFVFGQTVKLKEVPRQRLPSPPSADFVNQPTPYFALFVLTSHGYVVGRRASIGNRVKSYRLVKLLKCVVIFSLKVNLVKNYEATT